MMLHSRVLSEFSGILIETKQYSQRRLWKNENLVPLLILTPDKRKLHWLLSYLDESALREIKATIKIDGLNGEKLIVRVKQNHSQNHLLIISLGASFMSFSYGLQYSRWLCVPTRPALYRIFGNTSSFNLKLKVRNDCRDDYDLASTSLKNWAWGNFYILWYSKFNFVLIQEGIRQTKCVCSTNSALRYKLLKLEM